MTGRRRRGITSVCAYRSPLTKRAKLLTSTSGSKLVGEEHDRIGELAGAHWLRPTANRLFDERTYITPSDSAGVAISNSPIKFVAT